MNILYIDHYAGSKDMGMEFRPYYLSREWVKMGHNVTIIAGDYSHLRIHNPDVSADLETENVDGITYVWLRTGAYEGNGAKRAFTMFTFVHKLQKYAKYLCLTYNPDVVITSSTYPLDTYGGQKIAKLTKAKYIHEAHDLWPLTLYEIGGMSKYHPFVLLLQVAEDSAYKHCDDLVSLAPYTLEYMVAHGLDPQKFHNIQNGVVREEWESDVEIPPAHKAFFEQHVGKFIVGYFGGHALSNALDILLDAAKLCDDPDIVFVLVGKGIEKNRLIERKKAENINNIFFLDPVLKEQVPDLTKHFDCSIMTGTPSPLYRFGLCMNKMYDSMMAGKPVICAMGTDKTLVEQFDCGTQISEITPQNIVDAVYTIKSAPIDKRNQWGNNGRTAIENLFTYDKLADEFAKLFT